MVIPAGVEPALSGLEHPRMFRIGTLVPVEDFETPPPSM